MICIGVELGAKKWAKKGNLQCIKMMAPVNSLYHRTLCVKGGFSCFILSNLVHSVLAAFLAFAVGLLGLGYVHLQLFVTRRDSFSACFANENIF